MFLGIDEITKLTSTIIQQNREQQAEARAEKAKILEKLSQASGEMLFKLMNQISLANMDEFTAQARLHAQQSFRMCTLAAGMGFLIIILSVGFALYCQLLPLHHRKV